MYSMKESFDVFIADAIDNIPTQYQEKIKDVLFRVEDEPTGEQRKKLGLRSCDALFGLYEGVPLTNRNGAVHSKVPDVITIFRYPMMKYYPEDNMLKKQIFETVWHEVAHYFGLNHRDIHLAKNN
jgi:predicted Zn-dependent protease with MMP-like domain